MALLHFGKKKEESKALAPVCSCCCPTRKTDQITNDCCPDLKAGEIYCIKVLGAGCKSSLVTNSMRSQNRQ